MTKDLKVCYYSLTSLLLVFLFSPSYTPSLLSFLSSLFPFLLTVSSPILFISHSVTSFHPLLFVSLRTFAIFHTVSLALLALHNPSSPIIPHLIHHCIPPSTPSTSYYTFLQVIFSLYIDKKTNKRTAKNVRLTDEPVPGMNGDQTGILDVVVLR